MGHRFGQWHSGHRLRAARGQLTIDFIIVMTLLFTLLSLSAGIWIQRTGDLSLMQRNLDASDTAMSFARAINGVAAAGDGTVYSYELRSPHHVIIEGRFVRISWDGGGVAAPLITDRIDSQFSLEPGAHDLQISNLNGLIQVLET